MHVKRLSLLVVVPILISILLLGFQNCGKAMMPARSDTVTLQSSMRSADCTGSTVLGAWQDNPSATGAANEVLHFNSDCTGNSQQCLSSFHFEPATANSGNIKIEVTSNGIALANCLPMGTYTCAYRISVYNTNDRKLDYDCTGGGFLSAYSFAPSAPMDTGPSILTPSAANTRFDGLTYEPVSPTNSQPKFSVNFTNVSNKRVVGKVGVYCSILAPGQVLVDYSFPQVYDVDLEAQAATSFTFLQPNYFPINASYYYDCRVVEYTDAAGFTDKVIGTKTGYY